jgi:RHS repeat-associated protein
LAACNLNFISSWDIFKIYNDSKRSLLKDINKNIDGYDIRFHSREYSSNKPYLEVTYTLTMKKYYYIKDHLGSIRSVINESGTVVESNDYYPFGLKMPGRSYVSGTPSRNLFTGKERDDETGWDYFGARYYDPAIGRFLSVDPMASKAPDITPYHYTHNNPVNRFDPTGMQDGNLFTPKYQVNGIDVDYDIFSWLNTVLPDETNTDKNKEDKNKKNNDSNKSKQIGGNTASNLRHASETALLGTTAGGALEVMWKNRRIRNESSISKMIPYAGKFGKQLTKVATAASIGIWGYETYAYFKGNSNINSFDYYYDTILTGGTIAAGYILGAEFAGPVGIGGTIIYYEVKVGAKTIDKVSRGIVDEMWYQMRLWGF